MARPVTVTVGPLTSADPDGAAATQTVPAAAYMAINGTLTNGATANNVCLSQTPAGAGNLVLNGALVSSVPTSSAVAYLGSNQRVYFTSAADISNRTLTITGVFLTVNGLVAQTETLTGPNNNTVASQQRYYSISQIAISGSAAGAMTVGRAGTATFDNQRRVVIVSGADDSDINFTIYGTDSTGTPISETIVGEDTETQTTLLSFKTITDVLTSGASSGTVTIGTSDIADSQYVRFGDYASNAQTAVACVVSGSTTYDVEISMDDPNDISRNLYNNPAAMTWFDALDTELVAETTSKTGVIVITPLFARVTATGSGSVTATFRQVYTA